MKMENKMEEYNSDGAVEVAEKVAEPKATQIEERVESAGKPAVLLYLENTTTRPGWWW